LIEVLVPTVIAPKCYLIEALHWIAFNQYPIIENWDEHSEDARFSDDCIYDFEMPIWTTPTLEDCERVGLPPNPETYDTYHAEPDQIRKYLEIKLDTEDKEKFEKELIESVEFYKKLEAWKEHYNDYVEIFQSKLFIALKEGKLRSWGIRSSCYPDKEEDFVNGINFAPIPAKSWRLAETNWRDCTLIDEMTEARYDMIYVNTEELLKTFPSPKLETANNVMMLSGQYIINDTQSNTTQRQSKRGRRSSLDWDKVHLEIARKFKNEELPAKQEAFIADMETWCFEKLGHKPGRSTLLQKISPYYKLKKSENNKD